MQQQENMSYFQYIWTIVSSIIDCKKQQDIIQGKKAWEATMV